MKCYIAEDKSKNRIYIVDEDSLILRAYDSVLYGYGKLQRRNIECDCITIDAEIFDEYDSLSDAIKGLKSSCFLMPIGEFTAYKICYLDDFVLVELKVPEDAYRVKYLYGNKCRVNKAFVQSITYIDSDKKQGCNTAESLFAQNNPLVYKVGEYVFADKFDFDERKMCTNGIHCFLTKQEALHFFMYQYL